jgi:hypothetical protein
MSGFVKYDDCVEWAKSYIGSRELWIFEDHGGKFNVISLVDGQKTFDHYSLANGWIPRGRVFTEIIVNTMWTGGVIVNEQTN